MPLCKELKNDFKKIKNLKLELDLEFQKEKGARDYSMVQITKEKIKNSAEELDYKINPMPKFFRGKEGLRIEALEIGGKTKKQLVEELQERRIYISGGALEMFRSEDFTTSLKPELVNLIHLEVFDLGFRRGEAPTTSELYERIEELGLELCPPEVGPEYILKHADALASEWIRIGMKPIKIPALGIFRVKSEESEWATVKGPQLDGGLAGPAIKWNLDAEFVFCVPPPARKATIK